MTMDCCNDREVRVARRLQAGLPRPRTHSNPTFEKSEHVPSSGTQTKPGTTIERKITNLQLAGNLLEQMMAVGDLLAMGSLPRWESSRDVRHICVVVEPPRSVLRNSAECARLQSMWPHDDTVQELWVVRTMECRSGVFACAETVLYVEKCSGLLILLGTNAHGKSEAEQDRLEIELWQSPIALRQHLDSSIAAETVADLGMESGAVRPGHERQARPSRTQKFINTFPLVAFWQMYLCRLASCRGGVNNSAELVDKWIPSQADEMQVLGLLAALRKLGWVGVTQIPMLFHQSVHWERVPRSMSQNSEEASWRHPENDEDCSFDDRIAEAVDIAIKSGLSDSL